MNKFKVGAVGAGRATQELTVPAFHFIKKPAVLKSVCDPNLKLAKKVALEHNLKAYGDMKEMIEQEKLDIVILNTPVDTHAPLAVEAMQSGCHVIIEKPAVANLIELDEIKRVSEQTGKKVTVVHNYKYYEGPQKALELFQEGVIGDVVHVDRYFMSPPQNDRMEMDKQGWWHKMPGGRLADGLPHMIYLPYMFVGNMEVLAVSARKLSKDRSWSFCDEANIMLQTDKSYVNIRESVNQESWPYKGYIYHTFIYGTKLSLACNHHDAEILWMQSNKREVVKGVKAAGQILKNRINRLKKEKNPVSRGAHNVFYEKFFQYIKGEGPNPTTWEEAVNVATLTEQIALKMQECVVENKKVVI